MVSIIIIKASERQHCVDVCGDVISLVASLHQFRGICSISPPPPPKKGEMSNGVMVFVYAVCFSIFACTLSFGKQVEYIYLQNKERTINREEMGREKGDLWGNKV